MRAGRDVWYHEEAAKVSTDCPPEEMNAEDPLFILYTSGSTGKPKGVLHTSGGYLMYAAFTHQYVFDYHEGDIYWCTADVGWVTGHTYIVYGPLANGATTLMFEGVPNYPDRLALLGGDRQAQGQHFLHRAHRHPRADARRRSAGEENLAQIVAPARQRRRADQSRSVAVVLPQCRRRPLPDRRYVVADRNRRHSDFAAAGRDRSEARLRDASRCSASSRRSSMRTERFWKARRAAIWCCSIPGPARCARVYGDHQRFIDTYFKTYPGKYFTGDGCRRDEDGYYWITGRVDDVIKVSGHRLGTAEMESALVANHKVAEAAVVGFPHDIKGEGIYAYVTLKTRRGRRATRWPHELKQWVAKHCRRHCAARCDPIRAGPAENALGQNHAAHFAQDRGGRHIQSRRYIHARRSGVVADLVKNAKR